MTFSTLISFSTLSLKDRAHPSVENALFRLIKGLLVIPNISLLISFSAKLLCILLIIYIFVKGYNLRS